MKNLPTFEQFINESYFVNEKEKKEDTGKYDENGKKTGKWIEYTYNPGNIKQAPHIDIYTYVDGVRNGPAILNYRRESVEKGNFKDGQRDGEWEEHRKFWGDPTVEKGKYVKHKKEGKWIKYDLKDKTTQYVIYKDGKQEGNWVDM